MNSAPSFSGISSNDSFRSRATDDAGGSADDSGASSLLTKEANSLDALFGALYTIAKEKYTQDYKISITNVFLDWVQLMNFVITCEPLLHFIFVMRCCYVHARAHMHDPSHRYRFIFFLKYPNERFVVKHFN